MTDVETINRIAEILGSSGSAVVSEYTQYFIRSSIIWMGVGGFICGTMLFWKPQGELKESGAVPFIKAAIIFIGLLFIASNLSDLMSPKAMAIHQIIGDVRGH